MSLVVLVLLVVAVILNGAVSAKPVGYISCGLAVLALLIQLLGGKF